MITNRTLRNVEKRKDVNEMKTMAEIGNVVQYNLMLCLYSEL